MQFFVLENPESLIATEPSNCAPDGIGWPAPDTSTIAFDGNGVRWAITDVCFLVPHPESKKATIANVVSSLIELVVCETMQ